MTRIEILEGLRTSLLADVKAVDGLISELRGEEWSGEFHIPDGLLREQCRTVAIERVLEANRQQCISGRPLGAMRPSEIRSVLTSVGRSDRAMEVQVTTYGLAKRERIENVGRGLYRAKSEGSGAGRFSPERWIDENMPDLKNRSA